MQTASMSRLKITTIRKYVTFREDINMPMKTKTIGECNHQEIRPLRGRHCIWVEDYLKKITRIII